MELQLKVEGMSCGHCEKSVKDAVGALSGVESVNVSLNDKTVDVKHADSVSTEAIVEAIEDQGYDVIN